MPETAKPTRDQTIGQTMIALERAGAVVSAVAGGSGAPWDVRAADVGEPDREFWVKVRSQRPHRKHRGQGLERADHVAYVAYQETSGLPLLLVVLDRNDEPIAAWLSSLGPYLEETSFKPSDRVAGSVPIRYWRLDQFVPIPDAIAAWRANGHRPPAASLFDVPDADADVGRGGRPLPDDEGPSLTAAGAAARLGVSAATVYTMLARSEFPNAYRVGKLWRIPPSDVDAIRRTR